jgi:hypothetical protein
VDQACYKCGTIIAEGTAFCPKCNAPQIRVTGPELESVAPPSIAGESLHPLPSPTPISSIDWSQGLPAAALAGLIASVLIAIPYIASVGLGMLTAGFLAIVFYRRRVPAANLRPGKGGRLGAVSGAFGFGMFAVLTSIEMIISPRSGDDIRAQLLEALQQSAARTSDPQAQQMLDYFRTPPGLVLMMIIGLIFMLIAFVLLSALGGALGAALLGKKER